MKRAAAEFLSSPDALSRAARRAGLSRGQAGRLLQTHRGWNTDPFDLLSRADLSAESIDLEFDFAKSIGEEMPRLRYRTDIRLRRRGVEQRIVLPGSEAFAESERIDPALVKAVARSTRWFSALASGRVTSFAELAAEEGVSDQYVGNLIGLAFLAPEIVEAIAAGKQPVTMTVESLSKGPVIPVSWRKQTESFSNGD